MVTITIDGKEVNVEDIELSDEIVKLILLLLTDRY